MSKTISAIALTIITLVAGLTVMSTDTQAAIKRNNADYIKKRICEVFDKSICQEALIIAKWESGYRCEAKNVNRDKLRTTDTGVFQINTYWNRYRIKGNTYDCEYNIQLAKQIYYAWGRNGKGSWKAWATCKKLPKCY